MTLTPADRQRIREAFQTRVGNTALPSGATIDDLCQNLVLAIPALLETCAALQRDYDEECKDAAQLLEQRDTANGALVDAEQRIATLTAQLEAPCPDCATLADTITKMSDRDDRLGVDCPDCQEIAESEYADDLRNGQAALREANAELVTLRDRVAKLTAQLESDPCP